MEMNSNYEKLLERISKSADMKVDEIERKVEAKRAKLSGLISKEGAAQIVAAELGISFDNERLKISELVQGMRRANVIGKITKIFPVREFKKNDREGKIGSFLLGDETSNARVVLWDMNHIILLEKNDLKEGDVVEITNGNVRNGEIHLSSFSDIKKSNEKMGEVEEERIVEFGKLKDAAQGRSMKVRAVIVQSFEPRHFESKSKPGEKGVLLNIVLDDGTENIRAVMFNEMIKELGIDDEDLLDLEKFAKKQEDLLGEEKYFSGNFRINTYFNNLEFSVNDISDVNEDELVKELEARV